MFDFPWGQKIDATERFEPGSFSRKNLTYVRSSLMLLTLPTAKAGGFLRGTHSRELYSQGVCQKPPSHSLVLESVVTFTQDVGRSIDIGVDRAPIS